MNSTIHSYDVIIVGAGPAGTACALSLKNSGLKIALLDKAGFPRDKICGDAIGGNVKKILASIDPIYAEKLEQFPKKNISRGWSLSVPNGKKIELHFIHPGYISRRIDFDNFMVNLVKQHGQINFLPNIPILSLRHVPEGIELITKDGGVFHTRLLIGCDGAHSRIARTLANFDVDKRHYSGAVRAYYRFAQPIKDQNRIELFLLKKFIPGYFWIFPLDEHTANVGFGMLSRDISRRKIDLKKSLSEIIRSTPGLDVRFKNAELMGDVEGFGLPLGGKRRNISGERFMLCGDAASLIDPLNGEGIGNAMLSGRLAAKQVVRSFQANDFSGKYMKLYDDDIYDRLLPELRKKLLMQRMLNRTWLINGLVTLASRNSRLKHWLGKKL